MWDWEACNLHGGAWMVVFWAAIAILIVWVVRRQSAKRRSSSALTILDERFANGEIDTYELADRRRQLSRE